MPLLGLSSTERMPTLGIIYVTDSLLQNMTETAEIDCLR